MQRRVRSPSHRRLTFGMSSQHTIIFRTTLSLEYTHEAANWLYMWMAPIFRPITMPSLPTKMGFLQRLLTFITHRRQSINQSTTETHPPQTASMTSMFHGVRTVFIIGGTFTTIVNGKPQIRASSSRTIRQVLSSTVG